MKIAVQCCDEMSLGSVVERFYEREAIQGKYFSRCGSDLQ